MIIDNQGRNRMYVAIPKGTEHWRECIVCGNRLKLNRLLDKFDVDKYDVYRCVPEKIVCSREPNNKNRYFIYSYDGKKLLKVAYKAVTVAREIGCSAEYIRGKYSKTPVRRGVKTIWIKDFMITKANI